MMKDKMIGLVGVLFFVVMTMIIVMSGGGFGEGSSGRVSEKGVETPDHSFTLSEDKSSLGDEKTLDALTTQTKARVLSILDDAEVQATLDRIEKDEEKYLKDGAVFQNREKKLPIKKDRSYYSEWTVRTPGESDRGARRIVEGKEGELYFTDDHYDTFVQIR